MGAFDRLVEKITPGALATVPFFIVGVALVGYLAAALLLRGSDYQTLVYSMCGAVLAGGVFAVLLKSFQFIGVFKETLKDVLYFEPDFLAGQRDLRKIHGSVIKAAVRQRFPALAERIGDAVLSDYLPRAGEYYFAVRRTFLVEKFESETGRVEISDTQTFDVRAPGKEPITFRLRAQSGPPGAKRAEMELVVRVDNQPKTITPTEKVGEDGHALYSWEITLEGKDRYEIRRSGRIAQNILEDGIFLQTYTHFVEEAEVTIRCPFEKLSVDFTPLGFDPSRVKENRENAHEVRYMIRDLMFPRQGYLLQFVRRA